MNTHKLTVGLAGLVVGAACLTAFQTLNAQSSESGDKAPIAVLDVVQVFNNYQKQADLVGEMQTFDSRLQNENTQRREAIQRKQAAIAQLAPDDPAFEQQRSELMRMQLEYRNWTELVQAQMQREVARWSERIYREIVDTAGRIAEVQGFDVVLYMDEYVATGDNPEAVREQIRQRKVLYANERIDLTQTVLQRLNEQYAGQQKTQMINIPMISGS
jgi:Skp family chaperone for outer membrane proteins